EDGQNAGPKAEPWGFEGDGSSCNPKTDFFPNEAPSFWVHIQAIGAHPDQTPSYNCDSVPNYPWAYAVPFQPKPTVKQCDPLRLQSFSAGGIMVGIGDGSVRLVSNGV